MARALNAMTGVCARTRRGRRRDGDTQPRAGQRAREDGRRDRGAVAASPGPTRPLGARRRAGDRFSLKAPEEHCPSDTSPSDFWPPETREGRVAWPRATGARCWLRQPQGTSAARITYRCPARHIFSLLIPFAPTPPPVFPSRQSALRGQALPTPFTTVTRAPLHLTPSWRSGNICWVSARTPV